MIEANEIVPNLWQGSVPHRGNSLRLFGIQMLVLCAREWQLDKFGGPNAFPGVRVVQAPNDDSLEHHLDRPKLKIALEAAHQVVAALDRGEKVLVTCAAGLNRSGLVVALSLHLRYGLSGDQCIRLIRKKRASPKRPDLKPLSNPEFTAALRHLGPTHPGTPAPTKPKLDEGWGWSEGGLIIPL